MNTLSKKEHSNTQDSVYEVEIQFDSANNIT